MQRFVWACALVVLAVGCRAQELLSPAGVAYDAAGNLYIVDARKHQVFEVTLAGLTSVVAGSGEQGFGGDGGAAAVALLNSPNGIAVGSDGTIYIADTGNQRIRVVARGVIRTVAGSGAKGFGGDGGDALLAKLSSPTAVAVDLSGGLLIADSGNHRVRRLANGVLANFAGSGIQGFGGDGGPAAAAELDSPWGVAVASDGRVFVSDSHNHRLRVIGTDGKIATYAGSGLRGFSGDGGVAVSAALDLPRGVAVMANGSVVFADSNNQRLRLVDAQGVISTVAGSGVQGASGDGAAGKSTTLDSPRGVALSSFGDAVFADARNRLARDVAPDAALYGVAARGASVTLVLPAPLTYGTGSVRAAIAGDAPVLRGTVFLLADGVPVASALLNGTDVTFGTDALAAGSRVFSAQYAGDGIHVGAVSPALTAAIARAGVNIVASGPQGSYAGLPVTLTARIASVTKGLPTGQVAFTENGAIVATGALLAGVATVVWANPGAGSHVLMASYAGDGNFLPGTSAVLTVGVGAVPDFALTAVQSSQTVQGGSVANFGLQVSGAPGPFSGSVTFAASGLPKGATASFSPTAVIPGSSSATVTMAIQTIALASLRGPVVIWAGLVFGLCLVRKRRRVVLAACLLLAGCGDRKLTGTPKLLPQTFTVTVTATSTNVLGAVVSHSVPVTLVVD